MLRDNIPARNSPLIVEIIGLAGAGKTTLSRSLCLHNEQILPNEGLLVRNVRHMPYIIRHALLSLPTFLRQPRNGRWFTRRETAKIIYLRGWHRVLERCRSKNEAVIITDQGPIYDLATLYAFGPDRLHSQHFNRWWARMFNQWAHTVDLVIWLDASEEILIKRIRSREQWHPVKDSSVREMHDYLSRYQSAYEHIISELSAIHDLKILRFDTGYHASKDITAQILRTINLK